jgi:hypothetical protein
MQGRSAGNLLVVQAGQGQLQLLLSRGCIGAIVQLPAVDLLCREYRCAHIRTCCMHTFTLSTGKGCALKMTTSAMARRCKAHQKPFLHRLCTTSALSAIARMAESGCTDSLQAGIAQTMVPASTSYAILRHSAAGPWWVFVLTLPPPS